MKENLFTNGGEYKLPNGEEYIGPYHLHPEQGAMVGARHTSLPHARLTPFTPIQRSGIVTPASSSSVSSSSGSSGGY